MDGYRWAMILCALMFMAQGHAAEVVRCTTDDFGNVLCLDTNGVVVSAPREVRERMAREAEKKAAETGAGIRCAIDQFGNQVCAPGSKK